MHLENSVAVHITGGLGNQLFGLAIGLEQAKRLDCELVLDASGYANGEPRRFELASSGLRVIYGSSPLLKRGLRPKLLERSRQKGYATFRENGFAFDPRVNSITVGTMLFGYFQSPKYFPNVEADVRQFILDQDVPVIAPEKSTDFVTAHVRRGDYMNPETAKFHGISSEDYFKRGFTVLDKMHVNLPIRIFTDSPDEVAASDIAKNFDCEIVDDTKWTPWQTLNYMASGSSIIMSNSSFSWWAAWLMTLRDPKAIVVGPRPWFADGNSAHDLLLPNWLTLDNR